MGPSMNYPIIIGCAVTVGEGHTIGFQSTSTITENQESPQEGLPQCTGIHEWGSAIQRTSLGTLSGDSFSLSTFQGV